MSCGFGHLGRFQSQIGGSIGDRYRIRYGVEEEHESGIAVSRDGNLEKLEIPVDDKDGVGASHLVCVLVVPSHPKGQGHANWADERNRFNMHLNAKSRSERVKIITQLTHLFGTSRKHLEI